MSAHRGTRSRVSRQRRRRKRLHVDGAPRMAQVADLNARGSVAKYSAAGYAIVNGRRVYGPSLEELLRRQRAHSYSPLHVMHPLTQSGYTI